MTVKPTTEELILEAAKKVFLRKGMYGARMQDIADEAGINKALLHYYFRTKEKLFEIILKEKFKVLVPTINEVVHADIPLLRKLEKIVDSYLDVLLENPYVPIFVLSELHKNPELFIQKLKEEVKQLPDIPALVQEIFLATEVGTIRPIQPFHLIINVLSLCVFPFLAKPMFQNLTQMDDDTFNELMRERKTAIMEFITAALNV